MSVRHLAILCGAIGAVAVATACAPSIRELAGEGMAAECTGSIVELEFDPEGDIEARAGREDDCRRRRHEAVI